MRSALPPLPPGIVPMPPPNDPELCQHVEKLAEYTAKNGMDSLATIYACRTNSHWVRQYFK